jgi:hypothetical protein
VAPKSCHRGSEVPVLAKDGAEDGADPSSLEFVLG